MIQSVRAQIALLTSALAPLSASMALAQSAQEPNIIVVMTDDQGYGDHSAHGNPVLKTPSMDKLYSESVRFTDSHVAPMCTPTRRQLMTGRDAIDNGASFVCMGRSLTREALPTMADIFQDAGYATGHFGKWHLGDSYPFRPQDRCCQEAVHHGAWGLLLWPTTSATTTSTTTTATTAESSSTRATAPAFSLKKRWPGFDGKLATRNRSWST